MKKSRNLIILLGVLLVMYLFFTHKGKTPKEIGAECGKYTCGGMQPLGANLPCPDHCQCGEGDPMIPDAPRQCIPKV